MRHNRGSFLVRVFEFSGRECVWLIFMGEGNRKEMEQLVLKEHDDWISAFLCVLSGFGVRCVVGEFVAKLDLLVYNSTAP